MKALSIDDICNTVVCVSGEWHAESHMAFHLSVITLCGKPHRNYKSQ